MQPPDSKTKPTQLTKVTVNTNPSIEPRTPLKQPDTSNQQLLASADASTLLQQSAETIEARLRHQDLTGSTGALAQSPDAHTAGTYDSATSPLKRRYSSKLELHLLGNQNFNIEETQSDQNRQTEQPDSKVQTSGQVVFNGADDCKSGSVVQERQTTPIKRNKCTFMMVTPSQPTEKSPKVSAMAKVELATQPRQNREQASSKHPRSKPRFPVQKINKVNSMVTLKQLVNVSVPNSTIKSSMVESCDSAAIDHMKPKGSTLIQQKTAAINSGVATVDRTGETDASRINMLAVYSADRSYNTGPATGLTAADRLRDGSCNVQETPLREQDTPITARMLREQDAAIVDYVNSMHAAEDSDHASKTQGSNPGLVIVETGSSLVVETGSGMVDRGTQYFPDLDSSKQPSARNHNFKAKTQSKFQSRLRPGAGNSQQLSDKLAVKRQSMQHDLQKKSFKKPVPSLQANKHSSSQPSLAQRQIGHSSSAVSLDKPKPQLAPIAIEKSRKRQVLATISTLEIPQYATQQLPAVLIAAQEAHSNTVAHSDLKEEPLGSGGQYTKHSFELKVKEGVKTHVAHKTRQQKLNRHSLDQAPLMPALKNKAMQLDGSLLALPDYALAQQRSSNFMVSSSFLGLSQATNLETNLQQVSSPIDNSLPKLFAHKSPRGDFSTLQQSNQRTNEAYLEHLSPSQNQSQYPNSSARQDINQAMAMAKSVQVNQDMLDSYPVSSGALSPLGEMASYMSPFAQRQLLPALGSSQQQSKKSSYRKQKPNAPSIPGKKGRQNRMVISLQSRRETESGGQEVSLRQKVQRAASDDVMAGEFAIQVSAKPRLEGSATRQAEDPIHTFDHTKSILGSKSPESQRHLSLIKVHDLEGAHSLSSQAVGQSGLLAANLDVSSDQAKLIKPFKQGILTSAAKRYEHVLIREMRNQANSSMHAGPPDSINNGSPKLFNSRQQRSNLISFESGRSSQQTRELQPDANSSDAVVTTGQNSSKSPFRKMKPKKVVVQKVATGASTDSIDTALIRDKSKVKGVVTMLRQNSLVSVSIPSLLHKKGEDSLYNQHESTARSNDPHASAQQFLQPKLEEQESQNPAHGQAKGETGRQILQELEDASMVQISQLVTDESRLKMAPNAKTTIKRGFAHKTTTKARKERIPYKHAVIQPLILDKQSSQLQQSVQAVREQTQSTLQSMHGLRVGANSHAALANLATLTPKGGALLQQSIQAKRQGGTTPIEQTLLNRNMRLQTSSHQQVKATNQSRLLFNSRADQVRYIDQKRSQAKQISTYSSQGTVSRANSGLKNQEQYLAEGRQSSLKAAALGELRVADKQFSESILNQIRAASQEEFIPLRQSQFQPSVQHQDYVQNQGQGGQATQGGDPLMLVRQNDSRSATPQKLSSAASRSPLPQKIQKMPSSLATLPKHETPTLSQNTLVLPLLKKADASSSSKMAFAGRSPLTQDKPVGSSQGANQTPAVRLKPAQTGPVLSVQRFDQISAGHTDSSLDSRNPGSTQKHLGPLGRKLTVQDHSQQNILSQSNTSSLAQRYMNKRATYIIPQALPERRSSQSINPSLASQTSQERPQGGSIITMPPIMDSAPQKPSLKLNKDMVSALQGYTKTQQLISLEDQLEVPLNTLQVGANLAATQSASKMMSNSHTPQLSTKGKVQRKVAAPCSKLELQFEVPIPHAATHASLPMNTYSMPQLATLGAQTLAVPSMPAVAEQRSSNGGGLTSPIKFNSVHTKLLKNKKKFQDFLTNKRKSKGVV